MNRRRFLKLLGGATGASIVTGLYTWQIEPHWVEFVFRSLPIRNLPRSLEGKSLIQISDIHVGTRVQDEYLIDSFKKVSDLNPDLVVLTGDFISYHRGVFDQMERVYKHVPIGRTATVGILGNHDYGPTWRLPEVALRVTSILEKFGVTMLRNQLWDVQGLKIIGLDDLWAGQFYPAPPMNQLQKDEPTLVLSHNPDSVDRTGWGNYNGWILSGHTHGGQCKPPFLDPPLLPVDNRRYTAGEFALSGGRTLYINRGLGHLMKVRFNVRPEITVFKLASI